MRELRINLPDELWARFEGQSPQQMKSSISTVICLQFDVTPEPKLRKSVKPVHLHRGNCGQFAKNSHINVQLQEHETADLATVAKTLEPETPRENSVQKPETPQVIQYEITVQQPETPRENSVQQPANPPEISVQQSVSQPVYLSESKPDVVAVARPIKIHSSYAVGLMP